MAKLQNNIAIAYADTYFQACKKLPQSVLHDEITFRQKFSNDPTARGLNYEGIKAADDTLRSVRVNRAYRAIVKIPGKDAPNVYTLLWIDSHDEAYAWAEKKRIVVQPVTNAIEIYNVVELEDVKLYPTPPNQPNLFSNISGGDFQLLGINDSFQKLIRSVATWEDFEKIQIYLPPRIFESIAFLYDGIPVEEILEAVNDPTNEPLSFEEAIKLPKNSGQFFVVDSNEHSGELEKILSANIENWRIFLHPKQLALATRSFNGPVKVLGAAGTGKTVVAIHRAKWLVENTLHSSTQKILITTFTSSLAYDISDNLKELCPPEVFSRIEVVNLDKWVYHFLGEHQPKERIIYGECS